MDSFESVGELFSYISTDTPLISNLNIVENISLVDEAKYRVPTVEAQRRATALLEKLGIEDIGQKRPAFCTSREIFLSQFLRAYSLKIAKIAIIVPVEFLLDDDTVELIKWVKSKLDIKRDILIFDLIINESIYRDRGLVCHIER